MPVFNYRGVDGRGRSITGTMIAESESGLEEKLRATGYWLLHAEADRGIISEKVGGAGKRWMNKWGQANRRDLIEFCTLMSFETKAGIPLIQALDVAAQDCENPKFKKLIKVLQRDIEGGLLFYQALEKSPDTFAPNFVSMVRAGEMSAKLPETFEDLRAYLEWVDAIIADLRQASLYPAIVLTVVCSFVLFLFSFSIPKFAMLLAQTHAPLPMITQIMFGLSDFAKKSWWAWLGVLLLLTLGVQLGRQMFPPFAFWVDQMKLKMPIFGELNLMLSISRFTHNLAILYRSGIPILEALRLCQRGLIGNAKIEQAVAEVELA